MSRAIRRLTAVLVAAAGAAMAMTGAHAQAPSRLPLIAILEPGPASAPPGGVVHFKDALRGLGWLEGRTVRIESRYGDWQPDRMLQMAKELVDLKPDLLYTASDSAVRAAMAATTSIPIVVGASSDLVSVARMKSLAHPGGNVTGMTHGQPELDRKRLEVLKEAVPSISRIAFVCIAAIREAWVKGLEESADRMGIGFQRVTVRERGEIEAAFARIAKMGSQAVLVQDAPLFARHVDMVAALALRYHLAAISQMPRFADRGGLLQYGADVWELFRRSATHVDKILRGAKPGDLPVEQPTRVDLIVNLQTAKALGITIPRAMLIRADRVIE